MPFSGGGCAGVACGLHLAAPTEICGKGGGWGRDEPLEGSLVPWRPPHITPKRCLGSHPEQPRLELGPPDGQPVGGEGAEWWCGGCGGTAGLGLARTWRRGAGSGAGGPGRAAPHRSPFRLLGSRALIGRLPLALTAGLARPKLLISAESPSAALRFSKLTSP